MAELISYPASGVDYLLMDPFKRLAQSAAQATIGNLARLGLAEVEMSRGESAYLVEAEDCYLAHVEEGLGTKNLVADEMYRLTRKSYYDRIGHDCVAMIVNDLVTLGALPISVAMHVAVGGSQWFSDETRSGDFIRGWQNACKLARCTWAGGETATLPGIISPNEAVLSGSALGIVKPKYHLIEGNITAGDAIVLLKSSGIHANGLSLARRIAEHLFNGYGTKLEDDRTYGEALLDPTIIYVPVIEECLKRVEIHYAVHITGHGWLKLMRARNPFVYVIEHVPEPQPVFTLIKERNHMEDFELYRIFNMGAGFALYVPEHEVEQVISTAQRHDIKALRAGYIEKRGEEKKVVILPKGFEYLGETLQIR